MSVNRPPDHYWHCLLEMVGEDHYAVVNDLNYEQLLRQIVEPWRQARPFAVAGKIVRSADQVKTIRITQTSEPQRYFETRHDAEMQAGGIADLATDRRVLPISGGTDHTFELLFEGAREPEPEADIALVDRLCRRLPQAARILATRQRKDRAPFEIRDEYDVQDLLHGIIRAYLKYSVQEDPLPKVAGTRASRADISIEELGLLIEVKYVHGPEDQKRIFEEFTQDLTLYTSWQYLQHLFCIIYNSADLRDAEALEKLSGVKEINGHRFTATLILA